MMALLKEKIMIFLSNIGLGQFAIVFIECGVAG